MTKGLYVHIPFCKKRCNYCDFLSNCDYSFLDDYLKALKEQILSYNGERIDTVFIGGGTPTTIGAKNLEGLIEFIHKSFLLDKSCEFTVEANPNTINKEILSALKGANRLSIGVQSFDDRFLKALGRLHSAGEAKEAVLSARDAGFSNISIDLMFALPNQRVKDFLSDIKTAVSLGVDHISAYSLIIEENTLFYNMELDLPDEDEYYKMYTKGVDLLGKNGYRQYEISNFGKKECVHNKKYWQTKEYIAVGLGASSFLGDERWQNERDMKEYIKNPLKKCSVIKLTREDKMSEFVFMGLRMTDGISPDEFYKRFNEDIFFVYKEALEKHIQNGNIIFDKTIKLNPKKFTVSNQILCDFL